jgi:outer membrane beta-barrel protein
MFQTKEVKMTTPGRVVVAALLVLTGWVGFASDTAFAADSPGLEAIDQFFEGKKARKAVENRFFLKQERFEIAPIGGYVPNNPFSIRYVFGAILNYHFNEVISTEAQISYSPDLGENDLKGLTSVLLDRAYNSASSKNFQQPLDKVELSAAFGVAWSPFYGKINLVGETVLNFDLYGFAGVGMLAKKGFIATYDDGSPDPNDIVNLSLPINEVKVAPVIGIGQNYFLNQMMAFKIDARASFYVDNKPQYDPDVLVTEQRLYNNFIASAGLGFFFPKMKPRLYNF